HHIEHHQVDPRAATQYGERLGAIAGGEHLVPALLDETGREVTQRLFVVDNQHRLIFSGHAATPGSRRTLGVHATRHRELVDAIFPPRATLGFAYPPNRPVSGGRRQGDSDASRLPLRPARGIRVTRRRAFALAVRRCALI